ncbi:MAG TPA: Flp family type IVb pilin [Acidimicrobiia bacterium]|nr:Flp family type IVb pilin [Acidimicrobiia bacterium]
MQGLVTWIIERVRTDETGATAVEYGLLAALIAVVMAVGAAFLGDQLAALFNFIGGSL